MGKPLGRRQCGDSQTLSAIQRVTGAEGQNSGFWPLSLGMNPGQKNSHYYLCCPGLPVASYLLQGIGCPCRQQEPGGWSPGSPRATCTTSPACPSNTIQTGRQGPNIWPGRTGSETHPYQLTLTFGLLMGCTHTYENLADSPTPHPPPLSRWWHGISFYYE